MIFGLSFYGWSQLSSYDYNYKRYQVKPVVENVNERRALVAANIFAEASNRAHN